MTCSLLLRRFAAELLDQPEAPKSDGLRSRLDSIELSFCIWHRSSRESGLNIAFTLGRLALVGRIR